MVLRRVSGWTTVLVVVAYVEAHSWIACTDYLEKNGEYWNQVNCRAFPRHGKDFVNRDGQFGADRGYNINNPNPNNPCRTRRNDPNAYNARHPIAVYYPGQEVVLAHPTKNHVADVCTNKNIPDKGNFIFRGPKDGQSDPSLATFVKKLVADLGVSPTGNNAKTNVYPKPGYQNAPKFCENKDKALATNSFKIPQNLQPGRYTFLWAWFFNSRRDLYTSCWEVDVVETKAQRDAIYTSRKISTADPVDVSKGGSTSGGTTGGSTGGGSTGGGSTGGGSTGGGSTGGGSTGGGSTGGGSTGGGSTSGGSTGGRRESYEIKVEYGQSWGQGALGMIKMPTSRPSGDYRIVLQFKCKAKNINFWHAKDVSTGIQKKLGVYVLSQPEAHMKQKTFVGFNINFGACEKQSANSIVAYILEC